MLFADIVWPALVLEGRILTWWAIGAGLIAEFLVLPFVLTMSIRSAILADVQMNLVSSVAGIVWELFPGLILNSMMDLGTFNPLAWGATVIIAVLVNTMIEWSVLRVGYKLELERKVFLGLFLGNLVSVGLAFGSLLEAIIKRPNGPPQILPL